MKKNYIKNCMKEMDSSARLLRESFPYRDDDFADDGYDDGPDEKGYGGEIDGDDDGMGEEKLREGLKGDKRIGQIRTLCLQSLQDYAEDVNSEEYNFFKKLWLMCDKVVSAKENEEGA